MFHNTVVFALLLVCSMVECGLIPSEFEDEDLELDCSRFRDDFDVLRQLPLPVHIYSNSSVNPKKMITAHLSDDQTFVKNLDVLHANPIPLEIFCLSKLEILYIKNSSFENGIVPDALGNLKELVNFYICDTPLKKISEKFDELTKLRVIQLINCSLTSLPDMSNLRNLILLDASNNNLSHIDELPYMSLLDLDTNFLTEIPILKYPDALLFLGISCNPLKSASGILAFKNLSTLFMSSNTLTSIPRDIDKLQQLELVEIAANPLTTLPTTLLNLPHLEHLNVTELLLSFEEMVSIKKAFRKSRPATELFI